MRNSTASKIVLVLAAFAATCVGSASLAQPATVPATAPMAAATVPAWSSPEIEKIGNAMTGSWKSTTELAEGGDSSKKTEIVLHFAHVGIEGLNDCVYVEQARANQLHRPDREAIFQIYKAGDTYRIRTFEFRRPAGKGSSTTGMWLVPELFPRLTISDLVATMDLTVSSDGSGYEAKSTHPYPSGISGATEMTSDFKFGNGTLKTMDKGTNASGKEVWSASADFAKFTPAIKVTRPGNGLVMIDYVEGSNEAQIAAGDSYACESEGWLASGYKFYSSRETGEVFRASPAMPLIQGWVEGVVGASKGTIRRLIVPGNMAYVGMRRGMIPANAPLYFEFEVLSVEKAAAPAPGTPEGKFVPPPKPELKIEGK